MTGEDAMTPRTRRRLKNGLDVAGVARDSARFRTRCIPLPVAGSGLRFLAGSNCPETSRSMQPGVLRHRTWGGCKVIGVGKWRLKTRQQCSPLRLASSLRKIRLPSNESWPC